MIAGRVGQLEGCSGLRGHLMSINHAESRPLRLVIVDDHENVRIAVSRVLDAEPDLEVVGEAGSVAEARDVIARVLPDVAVLDLSLPDGYGGELVEHFVSVMPELRCVIHTGTLDTGEADALLEAGAATVVLKSLRGTNLVDAIRQAGPVTGRLSAG
jgi:two-component system response regulator DevR